MTAGADDTRAIVAEGDVPKVEPTRRHFAALIAGLKTAEECARVVERERDALAARVEELERRVAEPCAECGHIDWREESSDAGA